MESMGYKVPSNGERIIACKRDELQPGQMRPVRVGKRHIALIRTDDGDYKAMADICPHEGARLSKGQVENMWLSDESRRYYASTECSVVVCPWHNFEFDVDTGLTPNISPRLQVKTYTVRVEGEEVILYI